MVREKNPYELGEEDAWWGSVLIVLGRNGFWAWTWKKQELLTVEIKGAGFFPDVSAVNQKKGERQRSICI